MHDTTSQNLPPGERALLWKPKQLDGISVFKASFKRFSYKKHSHREFAIGVIERGAQTFFHAGSRYTLPPKTIVTVNPGDVHDGMSVSEMGYQYRMVYVDRQKISELLTGHAGAASSLGYFKFPVVHDDEVAATLWQALYMLDAEQHNSLASHTYLVQALAGLFHRHVDRRLTRQTRPKDDRIVGRALELIRARITENITLKEIASSVGLSPYHFLRIFKKAKGLPPHAYQIQMRTELAKAAIEQGCPLAKAAFDSGFSDQSHMTRCFKAIHGLTPGQYKNAFFNNLR